MSSPPRNTSTLGHKLGMRKHKSDRNVAVLLKKTGPADLLQESVVPETHPLRVQIQVLVDELEKSKKLIDQMQGSLRLLSNSVNLLDEAVIAQNLSRLSRRSRDMVDRIHQDWTLVVEQAAPIVESVQSHIPVNPEPKDARLKSDDAYKISRSRTVHSSSARQNAIKVKGIRRSLSSSQTENHHVDMAGRCISDGWEETPLMDEMVEQAISQHFIDTHLNQEAPPKQSTTKLSSSRSAAVLFGSVFGRTHPQSHETKGGSSYQVFKSSRSLRFADLQKLEKADHGAFASILVPVPDQPESGLQRHSVADAHDLV